MSDRIELRGLRVLGHHGANPGEQDVAQPFEIDVDVELGSIAASSSDDLADAVDYGALVAEARSIVETTRFHLLEALATAIAEALLARPGIATVTVAVRKLRPPVPADLASAGVRVTRPVPAP